MPADGIPRGVRYGQVPVWALEDNLLSCRARWLYALFCGLANRTTNRFWCSLAKIAARENVTSRTIQTVVRELQEHGLIEKVGRRGLVYEYEVIRDLKRVPEVRLRNARRLERQRERFGEHGRKGAVIKATRAASADDRAKRISPEGEEDFGPHAKHSSPRTESLQQNLTNRLTKGHRERLDERSEKEPGKNTCIAKGESGYGSFSQSLAEAPRIVSRGVV